MKRILLLAFNFTIGIAHAQWSTDPTINNAICIDANDQGNPKITSDGEGGAIITWEDDRGTSTDIFAQRIDKEGNIKWSENGITVCNALFSQVEPDLVSDGSGGVIIVWKDFRSGIDYDIYAQRVDADGNILWQNNGIVICSASGYQEDFNVIRDGNGGAIIVWEDGRVISDFNINAQRISSEGNIMWATNGIAVCSMTGHQNKPDITIDESGSAIIVWEDNRNNFADIYAQRVAPNGEFLWTNNGIAICTATNSQNSPKLTGDGSGGAVIVWRDYRIGWYELYTQRVDSLGVTQWQTDGILFVQSGAYGADRLSIVSDGNGGGIVCWDEDRTDQNYDIFAQRVDYLGNIMWQNAGIYVCGAEMGQAYPKMIADGNGGAIITWHDYRNLPHEDIFAQRVNSNGEFYWAVDGVPVCLALGEQLYPVIVGDGNGGAIIAWTDYRSLNPDIYAQQLNKFGELGNPTSVENDQLPVAYLLSQNYPNPFNPSTNIQYQVSSISQVTLKVYDILGNEVTTLVNEEKPAGSYSVSFDASELTSGVYFYKISAGNFVETKKMILLR